MGNELSAIIHAQMGGCRIPPEQLINGVDHIDRLGAPDDTDNQTKSTVFIHNIQDLESTAVHRLVELEVNRPHVVRVLGFQQLPRTVGMAGPLAPARQRPLEPILPPDPLHPLVIDAPAAEPQPLVDWYRISAHMEPGQLADPPSKLLFFDGRHRHGPLCVVRIWPAIRHSRRCETLNRSCRTITALRRRSGLRSFPPPAPTAALKPAAR